MLVLRASPLPDMAFIHTLIEGEPEDRKNDTLVERSWFSLRLDPRERTSEQEGL
jgi:hypothetical protein